VVLPGDVLVVDGAGLEAAVQDADESVRELPQGCVMADVAGAERVVVGPVPSKDAPSAAKACKSSAAPRRRLVA